MKDKLNKLNDLIEENDKLLFKTNMLLGDIAKMIVMFRKLKELKISCIKYELLSGYTEEGLDSSIIDVIDTNEIMSRQIKDMESALSLLNDIYDSSKHSEDDYQTEEVCSNILS